MKKDEIQNAKNNECPIEFKPFIFCGPSGEIQTIFANSYLTACSLLIDKIGWKFSD